MEVIKTHSSIALVNLDSVNEVESISKIFSYQCQCGFTGPTEWFDTEKSAGYKGYTNKNGEFLLLNPEGYSIQKVIQTSFADFIELDYEDVLDTMSGLVCGSELLMNISYYTIGAYNGVVKLNVCGYLDVKDWCEFLEEQFDDICECKKCGMPSLVRYSHIHQHGYVCPACWDERLRATE